MADMPPSARTPAIRATVLAELEAGSTMARAARAAGVSRPRASQIAREVGLPPRRQGKPADVISPRTARGGALLLRLTLAAADRGITPEQLLTLAESLPVDSGCVRGADE